MNFSSDNFEDPFKKNLLTLILKEHFVTIRDL